MEETHEGAAGNHSGGRALSLNVKSLGFYWPTMVANYETYARRCDKCQPNTPNIHCPTEFLQTTTAPYPFMRWAMDVVGPMTSSRQRKYVLIMTDYFTKWVEAKSLVQVTDKEVQNFVWKIIICRHGLPYEIVTDNGSQFIFAVSAQDGRFTLTPRRSDTRNAMDRPKPPIRRSSTG